MQALHVKPGDKRSYKLATPSLNLLSMCRVKVKLGCLFVEINAVISGLIRQVFQKNTVNEFHRD